MSAEELTGERHPSEMPITARTIVAHDVPAEWLDRLLDVLCRIEPTATIEEATSLLLEVAAEVLPDSAVGVCVVVGEGAQVVVRRSARDAIGGAPDPTKLFPEYAYERVVPLRLDEGSTLHLAADEEGRFSEGRPASAFAERLALALGATIRQSRAHERTARRAADVQGLQAQIIQSEKLASLGQIAAGIVHELNNPLTSIVAYSDYLHKKAQRSGGDPADAERLRRINEAAERILRFSRDLIAYSRPSAEVPAPVAIHEVIERALVFCEHVLSETGVSVGRSFDSVRPVIGVAGQLTQVFVNLFTNAAHAMRHGGGHLDVRTSMASDCEVSISVLDEGHGIENEHLHRIFEPFFTTKTDGSGTGLGLSIVRNIVSGHGGRIRAEPRSPRGTIFHVDLPVAAHPPSEP